MCRLSFLLVHLTLVLSATAQNTALFSFSGAGDPWPLGTFGVSDLDDDGEMEIVLPIRVDSNWSIDVVHRDGSHQTGFPKNLGESTANLSPTLADVTGDGLPEILFTAGTTVWALNGATGATIWSSVIDHTNYVPDSGYQTPVGGFYWNPGGAWLTRLPSTSAFSSEVSSLLVADTDNDGVLEVTSGWKIDPDTTGNAQDFNPAINDIFGFAEWGTVGETWSGGVVLLDVVDGSIAYTYHLHQLMEAGVAVGQADGDAALEIYALNDSDSVVAFDRSQPHGSHGNGTLHGAFGKNQRLISGTYKAGVDVYTTDIDGDGRDEVLVPTRETNPLWQPHDTILDDDGSVLWRGWKDEVAIGHSNANGWWNNACMIPVNPNHDNRIDVFTFAQSTKLYFREWNGAQLVDHPGWPIDFSPLVPSPPVVGDIDGDGAEEVVLGTYHPTDDTAAGALIVFSLAGAEEASVAIPGGIKHIPTLTDIDGNGTLDVVYRTRQGTLAGHNFGAGDLTKISWATHLGNARRDRRFTPDLFPPGTPRVDFSAGHSEVTLNWSIPVGWTAKAIRLYRSTSPDGPFTRVGAVEPDVGTYTDEALTDGQLYFYEVAAVYPAGEVRSATVATAPNWRANRVRNGGFETDDDQHWDKWFTGLEPYARMQGTTVERKSGEAAMEITLLGDENVSTIRQHNQYGVIDPVITTIPNKFYSYGGFIKGEGLDRASEHWIEWETGPTGEHPDPLPLRPFPDYFSPHVDLPGGDSEWVYTNRVFQLPPEFHHVEVRHRIKTTGATSGTVYLDDLFFRELPDPSSPAWEEWVGFGESWRYRSTEPSANWAHPSYDDSSWSVGFGKFGAGSGPSDTVTSLTPSQPKYYFRKQFDVSLGEYEDLLLAATATDDYAGVIYPIEVWVNGSEIESSGIETVTGAGNEERYFDLTPFSDLFNPGESNLIAVAVNNVWQPSWDNVAFDLALRALPKTSSHQSPRTFSTWAKKLLGNPNALPSEDIDGDLISNLSEFANGTDPQAVSPDPWPEGDIVSGEDLAYEFRFPRLRGGVEISVGHYEVGNLTYLIEISPSLGPAADWQTLTELQVVASSPVDLGDGTESVAYRLTAEVMNSGRYFVRQRTLLDLVP